MKLKIFGAIVIISIILFSGVVLVPKDSEEFELRMKKTVSMLEKELLQEGMPSTQVKTLRNSLLAIESTIDFYVHGLSQRQAIFTWLVAMLYFPLLLNREKK